MNEGKPLQVADDPALLDQMLADMRTAPEAYRPTNYWAAYERKFVPELKTLGLKDFRRRRKSVLSALSGTDLAPKFEIDLSESRLFNNRYTRRLPLSEQGLEGLGRFLNRTLPVTSAYGITTDDIRHLAYSHARAGGIAAGARSIEHFEASVAGNPEDVFTIEGRTYTMEHLEYYLLYAYCARFIDFDQLELYVELGSGSARQVEIIKKLHPSSTFALFDIPPQLYVAEQYLKTVFPGQVISYRDTRHVADLPRADGKIYMFGSWDFEKIRTARVDLFWNAASFQEMEPDVVANYLSSVDISAQRVFLLEATHGKALAARQGELGVLKATDFEDYRKGLTAFRQIDMAPYFRVPRIQKPTGYSLSFWTRT